MDFQYNEEYFRKHYGTSFYQRYIAIRNRFIWREVTKFVSSGKFLEIGFGDDNLLKFFKDDFDVFGIDISEYAVKKIKREYNPLHFKVCDISKEKIPFVEKFDVIAMINVIEHLENPKFALQNIFYSLKQNGLFVVYFPTQNNIFSRIQYKILYNVKEHVYRPSITSFKELMGKLGFKECKRYAASFIPLKISSRFVLNSFNLYLGFWEK